MTRVVIADDHAMVRRGIRGLLESVDGFEVIGEAANGQEAISLVQSLEPDVLVMDVAMPEMDGIKATRRIQALGLPTKVLILSMYSSANLVKEAIRIGAKGYLLKRLTSEELVPAMQEVRKGHIYLSRALPESLRKTITD